MTTFVSGLSVVLVPGTPEIDSGDTDRHAVIQTSQRFIRGHRSARRCAFIHQSFFGDTDLHAVVQISAEVLSWKQNTFLQISAEVPLFRHRSVRLCQNLRTVPLLVQVGMPLSGSPHSFLCG